MLSNMMGYYEEALFDIGKEQENIVVIDCDLSKVSGTKKFMREFPHRYINIGIAEQNAFSMAAGLANTGFIPIVHTFAVFASMRGCDQIRNSIAYPNMNVKIVGINAGISDSYGGATHHAIEDIGILSSIANLTILSPCDGNEAKQALKEAIEYVGPVYIRLNTINTKNNSQYKFEIGKAQVLKTGNDLTIISVGDQIENCFKACEILGGMGYDIRLINMATIKPIDKSAIIKHAKETNGIVVVETHNVINGLGSHICRIICNEYPVPVKIVGINDCFTESGDIISLQKKFSIGLDDIINTSLEILNKR